MWYGFNWKSPSKSRWASAFLSNCNSFDWELLLQFDLDLNCENIRFQCKLHAAYRPSVILLWQVTYAAFAWTIQQNNWCIRFVFNSFFFSELGDKGAWTAMDYANKFEQFWQFDDNVERIDAREVNCDEFIERFEKINKPVVIEGLQVIYVWRNLLFELWHSVCCDIILRYD